MTDADQTKAFRSPSTIGMAASAMRPECLSSQYTHSGCGPAPSNNFPRVQLPSQLERGTGSPARVARSVYQCTPVFRVRLILKILFSTHSLMLGAAAAAAAVTKGGAAMMVLLVPVVFAHKRHANALSRNIPD